MFGRRRSEPSGPSDTSGEPLANAAVVEAMKNVSVDDRPDARAMLFSLLLESTLLVVTPDAPKNPHARTTRTAESLDIVTLADEGGPVIPAFTSLESLSRWLPSPAGYLAMPSRALFEIADANGTNKIALDPGSPTWGIVSRYEIEQLARGRLPLGKAGDVVPAATAVRIGKPTTPPSPAALDALRARLAHVPSALRGWYFLLQQGEHAPELVIAFQFEAGVDPQSGIMRQIIDGAGGESDDVRSLAFVVADENLQTSLTGGSGELFFTRV